MRKFQKILQFMTLLNIRVFDSCCCYGDYIAVCGYLSSSLIVIDIFDCLITDCLITKLSDYVIRRQINKKNM